MTQQVHPDAQKFLDAAARAAPSGSFTPQQIRESLAQAVPLTGPARDVVGVVDRKIAGIPVRVYTPTHHDGLQPGFIYLHGGGWTTGTLDLADTTVREIAAESGAIGVSVDYRLAPEHPFPAALDDSLAVATALLNGESGLMIDSAKVAVVGESAGGNIAAVVAQQLRGHSPELVHQGLIYPCTDLWDLDRPSIREYAEGYFLTAENLRWYIDQYTQPDQREDARVSPARNTDLTGLPATTVIVAECDPLRDQGEEYGRALTHQGNQVTTVRFAGQVHPFVQMGGIIDDAHVARQFLGRRLRASFDPSTS